MTSNTAPLPPQPEDDLALTIGALRDAPNYGIPNWLSMPYKLYCEYLGIAPDPDIDLDEPVIIKNQEARLESDWDD